MAGNVDSGSTDGCETDFDECGATFGGVGFNKVVGGSDSCSIIPGWALCGAVKEHVVPSGNLAVRTWPGFTAAGSCTAMCC